MLRLHHDGVSARAIGRTLGVARSTIQDNLQRAQASGIAWPLPPELTDAVLEQRLFARPGMMTGLRRRSEPDWGMLARELKRPGVNLMVLWEEYRQVQPDGYGYSRFCDLFREFERRLSPVMRQEHVAGDKVFVDYSGKRIDNMRNGAWSASGSIIMSRPQATCTRCRTPSFAPKSTCASLRAPSRCSIAAGGLPPMSAAMVGAGMAPIPRTCRARIAATPNGRRTASTAGRARSGRTPKH
jgi:hypothetical protein